MDEQTITIPVGQFEELLKLKASIHALQCFVKIEKYPNRKIMCDIVGVEYKGDD